MNRLLLLLCCICVPWMARGQAAYDWHYWFDMNHASQVNGQALGERFTIETDASGLSEGIHAFHVQVADTAGKFSPPHAQLFYHTHDRSIRRLHYWFDNDKENLHQVPTPLSDLAIDVSELEPGLHFIYCQVEDAAGMKSDVVCRAFYRQAIRSYLKWTYWFDDDQQSRHTVPFPNEVVMIDVSGLQEGFHVLHNQIIDVTASDITTTMFIKIPQTEGVDDMTCICTIDGKLVAQETLPAAGGVLKWNMDVDNMDVGIHKAMFQVITPSGAASSIAERYFVRAITNKELGSMKCVYAIDNFETFSEAGTLSNGLFHFDLNISAIDNGLHRIAYMLVSENGVTTPQKTAFFWKTPLGGDGVVQYTYWVNDRDDQQHIVRLDSRKDPFSLITLLPVETQPIRTSNFQFAVKNGQPLIYARNDFHIQFYDTNGRMVEETKEYVDEQVTGSVESVGELQATQTFGRPTDGNIRWYWLEAEKGDQLEFKSDKACTIQLFSPSAEEIYMADGSTSVVFGGTHAGETGKYYLAVHDVTATSGTNLTFSYNHLDKFAVLDYSASEWGVLPGVQMMSVSGNGLDCVKSVVLTHGEYKIKADTIIADSKAEAHVVFVLNGDEEFGDYDLIFHFDNGESTKDITVGNAVTLTEPHFGDIDIAITDPRSVASPYPVTIKVTNTSNLTYSHIPFYMAYDNVSKITDMRLLNFDVEADQLLVDSGLVFIHDIEDFKQKGVSARMIPAVIPTLMPGETQTYRLGFKAGNHATYNVYAWTGTPWNLFANETMTAIQALAQSGSGYSGGTGGGSGCSDGGSGNGSGSGSGGGSGTGSSSGSGGGSGTGSSSGSGTGSGVGGGTGGNGGFVSIVLPGGGSGGAGANVSGGVATSCMPDPCGYAGVLRSWIEECTCATALGLGQVLAGIHNALHNRSNRAQREQLAASGLFDNPYEYFPDYYLPNPNDIFNNWLGHCIPYPGVLGKVMSGLNAFQNTFGGMPCPDPRPHPCNQWNPGDPNEIYGYLSEANSKFIADSIQLVKYTIEFENDTSLANASAHIITVRDTLDARYLDRSSFVPTGLKLGTHELTLENVDLEVSEGVTSFVKTIDMRPEIYAIAQVEGTYSHATGIAEWRFTSLDPMTMEPTDDIMQGILPVNYDGTSGIGEVMFEIGVKANKGDGAQIANRAGIVFDYEEAILTPTWVNTVDAVAPTSTILGGIQANDSTLTLRLAGEDARSGVWKYNVYAQFGAGTSWELVAENVTDTLCDVRIYEDIDYSFCVLATDSAGNVEKKVFSPEFSLSSDLLGDANGDGSIDLTDAIMITYHSLGAAQPGLNLNAADVNRDGVVDLTDAIIVVYRSLGTENGGAGQGSGAEPE